LIVQYVRIRCLLLQGRGLFNHHNAISQQISAYEFLSIPDIRDMHASAFPCSFPLTEFLTYQDQCLVIDIRRPLLVERSLVFQPLSIARYTRDLLAIIVRHRIRHTARTRINPKPLNSPIKLLLFFIHLRLKLPIPPIEHACPHNWTCQPTNSAARECYQAECDEGVERDL